MLNNMNTIPIYGMFTGVAKKKDGSAKVTFETREIAGEQAGIIWDLTGKEGYCCFSPAMIENIELPDDAPVEQREKTPSERLRSRLFVYFTKHMLKPAGEFNPWYRERMDEIGQRYLDAMNT